MKKCKRENCEVQTKNPKFCSKSCAARYNNMIYVKRPRTKKCQGCDNMVRSNRKNCDECIDLKKAEPSILTVGEVRGWKSHKHPSWAHAHIRQHGRKKYSSELKKSCLHCGYSRHLELCHIKAISSFGDDALVSKINSRDNVVFLCRNCHWELDHDFLAVAIIDGLAHFRLGDSC